jgi:hypothetical protein
MEIVDEIIFFNQKARSFESTGGDIFIGEQARKALNSAARCSLTHYSGERCAQVTVVENRVSSDELELLLNNLLPDYVFSGKDFEDLFFTFYEGDIGANPLQEGGRWNIIPLMTEDGTVALGVAFFADKWRISRRLRRSEHIEGEGVEAGSAIITKL